MLLGLALFGASAFAQQDRAAQQVRRAQLQLQALQQQLQQVQAERARLEAANADLAKRLAERDKQAGVATSAQRQLDQKLRGTESERAALAASAAELERQLADEKRRSAEALAVKDAELARAGQTQRGIEAREGELQQRFREQVRMATECSEKNERLVKVGAELIERYRGKGFGDVLRQREPLLGLSDVQTFNLLQDYRDRLDADRFVPAVPR